MKKVIFFSLLTLFTLLTPYTLHSQWVQQTSGTSNYLLNVKFINNNTGWACGQNHTIIKTTNGGINWISQNVSVVSHLAALSVVNSNTIFCSGYDQTILKTIDGGNNWNVIKTGAPFSQPYIAIFFINNDTGWLSSENSILKTTNSGIDWDSIPVFPLNTAYDIYFKDVVNGLFCSGDGVIFKTTNGGLNWYQVIVPIGTEAADFENLTFIGDTGWTIGVQNNKVYKTTNFGTSWDSLARVSNIIADDTYDIFFTNINTGYCGGNKIYKTTNGGTSWLEQNIPFNGVRSMYFTDSVTGWTVDGIGGIMHTNNGGTYVEVRNISTELPSDFELKQNYPNPFNPETKIEFRIADFGFVNMKVYDILGKQVATLVSEKLKQGVYEVSWNASNYSSGIYFYSIKAGSYNDTKKMVLIK